MSIPVMLGRHDRSKSNKAVALLATCAVLLGGAAACTFIGVTASPDPVRALLIAGGCLAGVILLLWLLRERPADAGPHSRWNLLAHARHRRVAYELKLKRRPGGTAAGAPPTVEELRQLRPGVNTWISAKGTAPPDDRG